MWLAAVAIREITHDSGSGNVQNSPRSSNCGWKVQPGGIPFIKANYWRDCIPLVRDAYLANAQNWVWKKTVSFSVLSAIMEGPISGSDVCRTEGRQARVLVRR
ncbi:hypothetical protein ACFC2A_21610 [Enterobacter hormaechei]